jgi:hypothetical protein
MSKAGKRLIKAAKEAAEIAKNPKKHFADNAKDCIDEGDYINAFINILRIIQLENPDDSLGKQLSILQAAAFRKLLRTVEITFYKEK